MYIEEDDISTQLRERTERTAILSDVSDDIGEGNKDGTKMVYNGSTAYSFNSNQ